MEASSSTTTMCGRVPTGDVDTCGMQDRLKTPCERDGRLYIRSSPFLPADLIFSQRNRLPAIRSEVGYQRTSAILGSDQIHSRNIFDQHELSAQFQEAPFPIRRRRLG